MNRIDLNKFVNSFLFLVFLSLPLTYILITGGFLVDDWGQLANDRSLGAQISSWQYLWSYRPVSWILIPTVVHLLQDNFILISLLHISAYVFFVYQLLNWEKIEFNQVQKKIAAVLILSPVFASTFLLSPVNQLSASLSLFFFSLGLYLEKKLPDKSYTRALVFMIFLISAFAYEMSLPFILMHFLFSLRADRKSFLKYFSLPLLLSLLVIWQKIIATSVFGSDYSRLGSFTLIPLFSFALNYILSIPYLLLKCIVDNPASVLVLAIFMNFLLFMKPIYVLEKSRLSLANTVIFLGFISNGALFLFSGRYAKVDGYANRGMTASWILFSLLLVAFLSGQNKWFRYLLIIIVAANSFLFFEKLSDSAKASGYRSSILSSIVDSKLMTKDSPSILILNVPCFLPDSSFQIEMFCTSWDAKEALRSRGLEIKSVLPAEDPDFFFYLNRELPFSSVEVVNFSRNFEVLNVEPLDSTDLDRLLITSKQKAEMSELLIAGCKSRMSSTLNFKFSGRFSDYSECLNVFLSAH
jgi:hypothetical protein